jgi:hypothetical protein
MPRSSRKPPQAYSIAQEIDWAAPWVEVTLRVELPFWLMTDNAIIPIEVDGHLFPVAISGETFELHGGDEVSDSKRNAVYQGPVKKREELSLEMQQTLRQNPEINILWRKCKTILRITSRCNEDVWIRYCSMGPRDKDERPAIQRSLSFYLEELCRAHIPVANKLIQAYRLATYEYFPFEVAPWDVPIWYVQRDGEHKRCLLVPYRGWDHRPVVHELDGKASFYKLIETTELQSAISVHGTQGELELLDALNLMERGDYSGAVRRVTTAIEVVVEAAVAREIEKAEGKAAAAKFLNGKRMRFSARVKKYETLSGRAFTLGRALKDIRDLRNRIVHGGYRITPGQRGDAQRKVDTGRWIFNWFKDDEQRRKVREGRIGFRSLGRDNMYGVFRSEITPEGVVVSP